MGVGKGFLNSIYIYASADCAQFQSKKKPISQDIAVSIPCIIVCLPLISLTIVFLPQTDSSTVCLLFSAAMKHFQVSAGKCSNFIFKKTMAMKI